MMGQLRRSGTLATIRQLFSTRSAVFFLGIGRSALAAENMSLGLSHPKAVITPVTSSERVCWIFSHMNKSGGQSVKKILKSWALDQNFSAALYDGGQWLQGEPYTRAHIKEEFTLTYGGYTEGLRPFFGTTCKWFTMFRSPLSRLVSAFYYCQRNARDQLCATIVLDAKATDIRTFAKHWGNYGLRQFLLAFVRPGDEIAGTSEVDYSICMRDNVNKCPAWYILKLYSERQTVCSSNHDATQAQIKCTIGAPNELWMEKFLHPVFNLLNNSYAAVGIIEQFETSLSLFNKALEMPDLNWTTMFASTGRSKYNKDKETAAKTLIEVSADQEVINHIRLDIQLYEFAVDTFNRQVKEYGLL